ncbi:MAG: 3,4-dihydroxy-2-butanone-4-phosphate synthase [Gammaproteobacteria bacterium]
MKDLLINDFGTPDERVANALASLRRGSGVLLLDDQDRENEGDLIFSAEHLTTPQMARLIRDCSGIVCLCMEDAAVKRLELPPMVTTNSSRNGTAFTVSIEARVGVTTGVSAADRVQTVKVASAPACAPDDLLRPGHVFPLRAAPGGLLERRGHTEGTVTLMRLAGLSPFGVLCELSNEDGSMARMPEVMKYGLKHDIPVLTVEDLVQHVMASDYLSTG